MDYQKLEEDVTGNFAIVSPDSANDVAFTLDGTKEDSTCFYNWISIWQGRLYSFDKMIADPSPLLKYKIVMFIAHPYYFNAILTLANLLRGKVITMLYPDGDASMHDSNGINSFAKIIYDAGNAVDAFTTVEEDKVSYFQSIYKSKVSFLMPPIDLNMSNGVFRKTPDKKRNMVLVYGDNNCNGPLTALSVIKKLDKPAVTVCIDKEKLESIKELLGVNVPAAFPKMSLYAFLNLLGGSFMHVYPTRWIGTSRESIACAAVGTPCIGSNRSHTQRRLWPKLTTDPYDTEEMVRLGRLLYSNPDFYKEVVNYAWDSIQFYNMENMKRRFLEIYETAKEKYQ